ncbi:MAG: MerR family transcriptional regulator [Candidatus Omnitrophica bacterium]|nr:MerR family transcriptional regulator [Candidatus Omnitrophota bacterium]
MQNIYLLKDLAQLSGVSIDTVKYYLKLGLIKEIERSPATNFRYFDDSTIKKLAHIRELRKNSVPLIKIKTMLDSEKDVRV